MFDITQSFYYLDPQSNETKTKKVLQKLTSKKRHKEMTKKGHKQTSKKGQKQMTKKGQKGNLSPKGGTKTPIDSPGK